MPCDFLDSDSFFENGMESEGERKLSFLGAAFCRY
jgi:hypothetical protein